MVSLDAPGFDVKGPRYTLDSFRSLGRDSPSRGMVGGCPRSVFLVKRRVSWQESGALVKEVAEMVEVGCRGRTCPHCSEGWRRYHLARMFSGTEGVPMERLRVWTLTAPGAVDDPEEWNRTCLERWKLVWRGLRRLHPPVEAYYGVKEFQARGLFHLHNIIRQRTEERLPRALLGRDGRLEELLQRHGFGWMHRWQDVYGSVGAAGGYLWAYLAKAVHDGAFPKWSHVDFWSRNWSLQWRQYAGRGDLLTVQGGQWRSHERWSYGGRTVGEALEKAGVVAHEWDA